MSPLRTVIYECIEDAFAAGVEWHTLRILRIDAINRGEPPPKMLSYASMLRHQQTLAAARIAMHLKRTITSHDIQ